MTSSNQALLTVVALSARLVLLWQGSYTWLGQRIEISTPVNQWMRVREGIALSERGLSPYSGDVFHEAPLVIYVFQALYSLSEWAVGLFFVAVDLLVAVCLGQIAHMYQKSQMSRQQSARESYGKGVDEILVKEDNSLPLFVALVYLLNPYSIVTCAGFSTISLTNLAVVGTVCFRLKGNSLLSALCLSLAAYLSFYPAVLIFPVLLLAYRDSSLSGAVKQLCMVLVCSAALLVGSAWLMGSWDYLQAVYGVMLSVPDQTPNLGLFWYFFTETFEHFRVFFLCVFQMNAFVYVIPLTIRFSDHPVFLTYILLSLTTLFKSYPCLGDLTVPLALLPLWGHTFRYLRYTLVVLVMFLVSSVLCPVLWYLWIHTGSANANFFFAMTLTYSLAQIFLVADVIYSFLVHQYDLQHGLPRVDQQGKIVRLKLS